jgi:muconolactone delta-isomerase
MPSVFVSLLVRMFFKHVRSKKESLTDRKQDVMKKLFMVEFTLPQEMTEEFVERIPAQRNMINYLLGEGKIRSYSLASDRSKLWAVFLAENEFDVLDLIAQMPLGDFMVPHITELMFHNSQEMVLQFSLN